MNVLEDQKIKMLISRRDLSKNRIKSYKRVFTEINELFNKTPSELIEEARNEQLPDWDNKIFIEMEDRKISYYFNEYYNYLKNVRKNNPGSIQNKHNVLRAFYREYNIEVPKPINLKIRTPRVRKRDLLSWEEDVEKAVEETESLKLKAIILFLVTSGLRISDMVKLTIGDFLEATEDYHNGTIGDLLKQDPSNIIPSWDFDPQKTQNEGNLCITFNTPETVKAIFNYLNKRILNDYSVSDDSPLFRSNTYHQSNNYFYESSSISFIFREEINPLIGSPKDKIGRALFRPQNLRKLFETTCNKHIGKAMFAVEEKKNEGTEWDIVALLTGHKPYNAQIKHIYDAVEPEDIKPYYEQLIPYLSTNKVDVKTYKSQDVIEMEKIVHEAEEKAKISSERQVETEARLAKLEGVANLLSKEDIEFLKKLKK